MRGKIVAVLSALLLGAMLSSLNPATAATNGNPFAGKTLYVNKNTTAQPINQVAAVAQRNPSVVNTFVASVPQAVWLTPDIPTSNIRAVVSQYTSQAAAANAYPVFVLYAVPERDCGAYSAGGFSTPEQYQAWVSEVAAGIGDRQASVIVEPDALMLPPVQLNGQHYGYCNMTDAQISQRYTNIRNAVYALAAHPNTAVYIDAGHSRWWYPNVPTSDFEQFRVQEVAKRLQLAGIDRARGFSLNVSNFFTTSSQQAFGEQVSSVLGGNKYYVIDTSRNGNGPDAQENWCNPAGRALGQLPTANTGAAHNDALLWIKHPGESDGTCHAGDPTSGYWFQSYVDGLYSRAPASVTSSGGSTTPTTSTPTTSTPTTSTPTTSTPTTSDPAGPASMEWTPVSDKASANTAVWLYSLAVQSTRTKLDNTTQACTGDASCVRKVDQYQRRLNIYQSRLLQALVAYSRY